VACGRYDRRLGDGDGEADGDRLADGLTEGLVDALAEAEGLGDAGRGRGGGALVERLGRGVGLLVAARGLGAAEDTTALGRADGEIDGTGWAVTWAGSPGVVVSLGVATPAVVAGGAAGAPWLASSTSSGVTMLATMTARTIASRLRQTCFLRTFAGFASRCRPVVVCSRKTEPHSPGAQPKNGMRF
jgi:hypothetical protein